MIFEPAAHHPASAVPHGEKGSFHLADSLAFDLPEALEASAPPEARGLARDEVRLLVSYGSDDRMIDARFSELDRFLEAGDLLVINTSGTMNAALPAERQDGSKLALHLSTRLPADLWIVELRQTEGPATRPFREARAGERLALPGGASATLHVPHAAEQRSVPGAPVRLWIATLQLPETLHQYLDRYGSPIRYSYVNDSWPLDYYQTVYATEMGSAEMPSAGRAFTAELLARLVARGIRIAPLLLHTGVASLEEHEPPYEEFYRVPAATARAVNETRAAGGRVIAVGTTSVRALETTVDEAGTVHPGEGWTSLVITPARGLQAVNGMLTGFHEPRASHLAMLEALAGRDHLAITYRHARQEAYLWHEFGDLHLILP